MAMFCTHSSMCELLESYLEDEVCPDGVEHEEAKQQNREHPVRTEGGHIFSDLKHHRVQYSET